MLTNERIISTVVLLASGTVGTTATEAAVGEDVTVLLHDENGMPITETGRVEEVLETTVLWSPDEDEDDPGSQGLRGNF